MSTSPKIIPFRILLRLFPRAIALLGRVVAARAPKRHRPGAPGGLSTSSAAPPERGRTAESGDGRILSTRAFNANAESARAADARAIAVDASVS